MVPLFWPPKAALKLGPKVEFRSAIPTTFSIAQELVVGGGSLCTSIPLSLKEGLATGTPSLEGLPPCLDSLSGDSLSRVTPSPETPSLGGLLLWGCLLYTSPSPRD